MDEGLKAAIDAAGTKTRLAGIVGVSQQAVSHWRKVPVKHARTIRERLGVPLYVLRPDLWPRRGG